MKHPKHHNTVNLIATSLISFSVFLLGLLVVLGLGQSSAEESTTPNAVYIDPSLTAMTSRNLPVIVTSSSSEAAAAAVILVGGTVESDLWLIDGVSASVPADQLDLLQIQPGVRSIIQNQEIESADHDPYAWEGWATDRRTLIHTHALDGTVTAPLLQLPDSGVFAVNEKGEMVILNEDGTLRNEANLQEISDGSEDFVKPAVVSGNHIFVASEEEIYAIEMATGELAWFVTSLDKFAGGVAAAGDHLIVADEETFIYGLDINNGALEWTYTFGEDAGKLLSPPTLTPDGNVVTISENGFLVILNPQTGEELFSFFANEDGGPYQQPPQFDQAGNIYFFGKEGFIYRLNPDGTQAYLYTVDDQILAQSIVLDDGSFYAGTKDRLLVGLDSDGLLTLNIAIIESGHIESPLVFSEDLETLFVTIKEGKLLAYDIPSSDLLWVHSTEGDLKSAPVIAPNGNVHLGDKDGVYEIINPASGLVVNRHNGFEEFTLSPILTSNGSAFFHDKKGDEIIVLSRIPIGWSETIPHVEPTEDPLIYKVANPLSIDTGADIAHENGVTGTGIGIAVIDSGVYFDNNTIATLGAEVQDHFSGQAEFVGAANCADTTPIFSDCFSDHHNSPDGYGHGSHVAGIIWNNGRDYYTGASLGIAPDAEILSIRVLDDSGVGSYGDVIEGIQYVVANKDTFNIRVMNLSLSAPATVPYFVDPFNRAVEQAWAAGIVVLAAAGNEGPQAQTITVPGNDPYVITIGALDSNRSPGYWADDAMAWWSSTGPTLDGFIKPDVIVQGGNVVSYMYNDGIADPASSSSATLVQQHPDYAVGTSLFRMNGTSMATAVASGVVALMLDDNPALTPDEVKFRLKYAAKPAQAGDTGMAYSLLQQGAGRIWVPDTIFNHDFPVDETGNDGLDLDSDLAHGWMQLDENGQPIRDEDGYPMIDETEIAFHYQGSVQLVTSDDGSVHIFYLESDNQDDILVLGGALTSDFSWLDYDEITALNLTFEEAELDGGRWQYADLWSNLSFAWGGGNRFWSGGNRFWGGGNRFWGGGNRFWGGGNRFWGGGNRFWGGGNRFWGGSLSDPDTGVSSTSWVEDELIVATPSPEPTSELTAQPTSEPTFQPTSEPTALPTAKPTSQPTASPTAKPTSQPVVTGTPNPLSEERSAASSPVYAVYLPLIGGSNK